MENFSQSDKELKSGSIKEIYNCANNFLSCVVYQIGRMVEEQAFCREENVLLMLNNQ